MTKKFKKQLEKNPVGRPSEYDPKFCQMLLVHMESGLSFEAFAGLIGVSKQTLYTWTEKHREFMDAKSIGQAKSLLWWEKEGQKGLWDETSYGENGKPDFKRTLNSTIWIFSMKNRHGWKSDKDKEKLPDDNRLPQIIVNIPDNGRAKIEEGEKK